MRTQVLAASLGGALLAATVVAVPAVAAGHDAVPAATATTSATAAPTPLTADQQQLVERYLAAHPGAADRLADRAADWQRFAAAHPALSAELTKVAKLPKDQRRAELRTWLTAHPGDAAVLRETRQQARADRKAAATKRQAAKLQRKQARQERRADRAASPTSGATTSPTDFQPVA